MARDGAHMFPSSPRRLLIVMPTILDLFCGEGGSAYGYKLAGWSVIGVDLHERFRKRYPGHEYIVADALEYVRAHGKKYDAIHASPPCQGYSIATAGNKEARNKYSNLIPEVREELQNSGCYYVIENVAQAAGHLIDPITLCGTMFNLVGHDEDDTPLEMWRHRLFESNLDIYPPGECTHGHFSSQVAGSYGGGRRDKYEARYVRKGGYVPSKRIQEELMGIDWMTQKGLFESLPPCYTKHIGKQLLTLGNL